MKRQIIIDTDPGIDDAIAIALALSSEKLDVRLITTVNGNVGIENVTENALKLLSFLDSDVKVARGASRPLLRNTINAANVHGETGMEGYVFPRANRKKLLKENAVEAMYRTLTDSKDKITLVTIGPLTNIAMLIRSHPEIIPKIEEIVMMGGAFARGNFGVYSEFNIACDPEAAKIVLESKIPIIMCTLDVGLKIPIYKEEIEEIRNMNELGEMFYGLFQRYRSGSFDDGLRMFDSCAVAYLLKPNMFQMKDAYVAVETKGHYTYGATCIDYLGILGESPNVKFTYDIDVEMFKKWFLESIRQWKK